MSDINTANPRMPSPFTAGMMTVYPTIKLQDIITTGIKVIHWNQILRQKNVDVLHVTK
jgi:hypothetical protein